MVSQRRKLRHAQLRRNAAIDNARRVAAENERLRAANAVLAGAVDGALRRWHTDRPHQHPTHAHALGYLRDLLAAHDMLRPDDQHEHMLRLNPAPPPTPQENP